jgi:hypothetical protein
MEETFAILAIHRVIATFASITQRQCMGRTSRCPQACGHSGSFATFSNLQYTTYEKRGEYGDDKAESFLIQLTGAGADALPAGASELVAALKPGDRVRLGWDHQYVKRVEPQGGESQFPRRPVVLLERAA